MGEAVTMVTGAAGLIGNALRTALEAGGREVLPLDLVDADAEGRPVTVCDVADLGRLQALAIAHHVDAVAHCGALSGPMLARDDPAAIVRVNLLGTANLIELGRLRKLKRVVLCSSTSAVGPTFPGLDPVPEEVPLHPSTVYGASKAAGEALAEGYARQHGVDAVSLRICFVYGPRRRTACPIREMIRAALAGRAAHYPFGGDFPRQYVHVDDVVRALIAALDAPRPLRPCYSITGGGAATLAQVADIVRRIVPGAEISVSGGDDPGDDRQALFDLAAAERDLGYRPQVMLEDGVRAYAAWLAREPPEHDRDP